MLWENLLKMPWSHVTQLLEALQKDELPPHLVQRMRLDSQFRQSVVQILTTKYRDDPGEKFRIEVDRTKSRVQLNTEIKYRGTITLRDEIVTGLQPKTIFCDTGQGHMFSELKPIEAMDVWTVPLWQDTTEQDAITLLDYMGYESVQTEEALTFALLNSWGYNDCIVVLTAKCHGLQFEISGEMCTTGGFLSFGTTISGNAQVSLYDFEGFSPKVKFLVKRKQSQVAP